MTDTHRVLYDYYGSTAAHRVRIALNLKGLKYQHLGVHLLRSGGEQLSEDYRRLNPQLLVPTLCDNGVTVAQSLAILEYLEEQYPEVALLPPNIAQRAMARQIALTLACEIQPLNNLRVDNWLENPLRIDRRGRLEWAIHWTDLGFTAVEQLLAARDGDGTFCIGEAPTIADCCLVPQVVNARRFGVDISRYTHIERITSACEQLDAFRRADPSAQPDSE